jgi:D-beta-D-heptose 7-phosphate kinase/D-beta-D-heptose 1-phosphate adenosyltransferase
VQTFSDHLQIQGVVGVVTVAVSGGFDPVHVGHLRMLQEARGLGDELVIILNNDNWLRQKKGYVFMPQEERKEILLGLASVDGVWITGHKEDTDDMSVAKALEHLRPDIFANGGDRGQENTPEKKICKQLGIEMRFNVGGEKVQSSSDMVKQAKAAERTKRLLSSAG